MKFNILSLLLVASTAAALAIPPSNHPEWRPYYPRQSVSSINSTLSKIKTSVGELTKSVNAYNGGLVEAASIATKQSQLDGDIKTATNQLSGMKKLSSADSMQLVQSANALTPGIITTVNALVSKKTQFQAAGIGPTVGNDVKSLKADTDTLGMAIVGITSDDQKVQAMQNIASIDAVFQNGIATFS